MISLAAEEAICSHSPQQNIQNRLGQKEEEAVNPKDVKLSADTTSPHPAVNSVSPQVMNTPATISNETDSSSSYDVIYRMFGHSRPPKSNKSSQGSQFGGIQQSQKGLLRKKAISNPIPHNLDQIIDGKNVVTIRPGRSSAVVAALQIPPQTENESYQSSHSLSQTSKPPHHNPNIPQGLSLQRKPSVPALRNPGLRHRASLPVMYSTLKQQPPATTIKPQEMSFHNMHKLVEVEINLIGKPLVTTDRVLIRQDVVKAALKSPIKELHKASSQEEIDFRCGTYPLLDIPNPQDAVFFPFETFQIQADQEAPKKVVIIRNESNKVLEIFFSSRRQRESWLQSTADAIDAYKSKKRMLRQRASNSSLRSTGSMGHADAAGWSLLRNTWNSITTLPGSLGRSTSTEQFGLASNWIPDNEATMCMICHQAQFSLFVRKHHCRKCGRVICHGCSLFRPLSDFMDIGAEEEDDQVSIASESSLIDHVRICLQCDPLFIPSTPTQQEIQDVIPSSQMESLNISNPQETL